MLVFHPAKINLGLHIVSKRSDGYHNIETIFYPIDWNDAVEVLDSDTLQFDSYGLPIPGNHEQNLCIKAYHLLAKDFDLPAVRLILQKNIPMGAGLGGGSSDAAAVLKLLNSRFELNLSTEQLQRYARSLGADCAFFIEQKPVFAFEKGDVFEPLSIDLSRFYLLVIHPAVHVSTQEAYAGVRPQASVIDLRELIQRPIEEWRNSLRNDFENSVLEKYPLLLDLKNRLYAQGALYASMSGSGSAIFGLFEQLPRVEDFSFPPTYKVWAGKML